MPAYYALIPGILVTASVVPRVLRALATSRWSSTTGRVLMRDIDETAEKYQPVLERGLTSQLLVPLIGGLLLIMVGLL